MGAKEPAELRRMFQEAIRSGDAEAAVALFEPEAVLTTLQGDVCSGTEAIRGLLTAYAGMKPRLTIENLKTLETDGLALMYNSPRHEGLGMEGRAVEIARRQPDGSWLYAMVFHPTG